MLYDYYFLDWFSLLHFWWGTIYGWIFSPISIEGISYSEGFLVALLIAVVWEIVENSQWWIDHVKCYGIGNKIIKDSWANIVGDIFCSSVGYFAVWYAKEEYLLVMILSWIIALGGGLIITICLDPPIPEEQHALHAAAVANK